MNDNKHVLHISTFFITLLLSPAAHCEVATVPGSSIETTARPPVIEFGKKLSEAADRVLATVYQNCAAPRITLNLLDPLKMEGASRTREGGAFVSNVEKITRTHPYLSCEEKNKTLVPRNVSKLGDCPNTCRTPVLYEYGAGRNGQGGPGISEIDPFDLQRKRPPFYGVDCSAFLTRATMAAGLNLVPGGEDYEVGAAEFTRFGTRSARGDSCFEVVDFSKSNLQPGDIVAWPNHVFMISETGKDPLGLEQFKSAKECTSTFDNYDLNRLNFTIVQSAPYPSMGSIGPSKVFANEYYLSPDSGANTSRILNLTKTACLAKFQKSCTGNKQTCFEAKAYREGQLDTVVLRHIGDKNPSCLRKPASIKGEECVGSCH